MPNFFTDNEDIQFFFKHMDIAEIVSLQERQYAEAKEYDEAPSDYADAIDNYRRTLEVTGDIAGEFIAPKAAEVDEVGAQLHDGKVRYAPATQDALRQLTRADLTGFTLPRKHGGLNMPVLIYSMAIEMVARADASLMTIFG
ncbi:MAG: acyl-CoA dehydrogenase, partial [Planctomycetes bacterium]|nr:acyl-CoA dehydrogenase [Planctomycetota bacterium]